MENKKRILAWILSLAMVFGLFGGQASVAKAADAALSFASADVSTKKLPSDGGTVKVTLTFDDFSADEGTIYYRLRKDGATVSGKENVTVDVSRTNNTFDIDVPANTGTEEESYQIWISNTSIPDWQLSWNGAKTSFKVTAPSSENPDQPETTKVLPDKTHFRARAVDKSGKPVAGVKFDVKNSGSSYGATTVTSDEKAISEKVAGAEKVTAADYQNAIQAVKDAEAALVKAEAPKPEPEVKKVASVKLAKTSYVYDGKVKKPAVVAKNNKGEKITSKDYTVKYAAGCKNVGTYTVKVTFKGDYKGTFTKTFNINPKGTSLSKVKAARKSFSATWKKQSKQTSGYQLQYSTNKKFAKAVKTSTISKNTTVKKTVKKLSAKKTYYVRVRTYKTVKVGKKSVKIYSGWSAAKKVKTK